MTRFRDVYLADCLQQELVIADLGSYDVNGSYRSLFAAGNWRYLGLDVSAGPNVDQILRNPYRWREVASNSVDVMISGQAFEHIEFFWLTCLELSRVLKPGGLCCLIAPSAGPEHRYPLDCWRFYSDGMRAMLAYAGLDIISVNTYREPADDWTDDSSAWQDSVVVARQPEKSWRRRCREWLYRYAGLHVVSCPAPVKAVC